MKKCGKPRYAAGGVLDLLNSSQFDALGRAQQKNALATAGIQDRLSQVTDGTEEQMAEAERMQSTLSRIGRMGSSRDQARALAMLDGTAAGLVNSLQKPTPATQPTAAPTPTAMPTATQTGDSFTTTLNDFAKMYGRVDPATAIKPTTPTSTATQTPTTSTQTAITKDPVTGAYTNVKAGYAKGGKIVGPGTGTSDSIDAKVGGKEISLSNGEYVLPKKVVDAIGVETLDALVRALNGKEPGPEMGKDGKLKAATGGIPRYVVDEDGASMDNPDHPEVIAAKQKALLSAQSSAPVPRATAPSVASLTSVGGDGGAYTSDPASEAVRNAIVAVPRWIAGFGGEKIKAGVEGLKADFGSQLPPPVAQSQQPVAQAQQAAPPQTAPRAQPATAPQSATPPLVELLAKDGVAVPKYATERRDGSGVPQMEWYGKGKGADAAAKSIDEGRTLANGTGVVSFKRADGTVRNVVVGAPEQTASQDKATVDYSPAAQYQRMRTRNLMFDAFSPEITDPRVRDSARAELQAMGVMQNAATAEKAAATKAGVERDLANEQIRKSQDKTPSIADLARLNSSYEKILAEPTATKEDQAMARQGIAAIGRTANSIMRGNVKPTYAEFEKAYLAKKPGTDRKKIKADWDASYGVKK